MTLGNAYMQIVYLHQVIDFTKIKLKAAIAKLRSLIDKVIKLYTYKIMIQTISRLKVVKISQKSVCYS